MKCVYVLVSNENDFYTEQALVSIFSLKKTNRGMEVVLVTDTSTAETLKGERGKIKKCIDKFLVVDLPENLNLNPASRFIKTQLTELIDGEFVYIDCDTIITGKLDGLESLEGDIVAANYRNGNDIINQKEISQFKKYYLASGLNYEDDIKIIHFYNSGVIYCRNNAKAKEFYTVWHNLWLDSYFKYGYYPDQPDMSRANVICHNVIKELPGIYNCMISYPYNAVKFINDCRIFHYIYSGTPRYKTKLNDRNFWNSVKRKGIGRRVEKLVGSIKEKYTVGLPKYIKKDKKRANSKFLIYQDIIKQKIKRILNFN